MPAGEVHPGLASVRMMLSRVGLTCSEPVRESTNSEYCGCVFATWRRGDDGNSEPFDDSDLPGATDGVDHLVISARERLHFGVFVLPTPVLVERGIVAG